MSSPWRHIALFILYFSFRVLAQATTASVPLQFPNELPALGVAAVVNYDTATCHWQVEVVIGEQKFNLTVDTGSSDLWVYSPKLYPPFDVTPVAHNTYTCKQNTMNNCTLQGNFSISYGNGAASGYIYYDTVEVAGATVSLMGVERAGIVEYVEQYKPDGILGLGFKSDNHADPQQSTFMERLMSDSGMHTPVFTVDFKPPPTVPELEFGIINYDKAKGPLSKVSIDPAIGRWQVDNITFTIGTGPTSINAVSNGQTLHASMLFDTGGGYGVYVPYKVAAAYYTQIPGSYNTVNHTAGTVVWNFPCNVTVPDLTLNVGNGTIVYNTSILSPGYDPNDTSVGCGGQLMTMSVNDTGVGNLGAAFFANHFVVFNQAEPSVMWG